MKTEILTLHQNIDLHPRPAIPGHLTEAVIDVKKGTVASDKPVQVTMLNGSLLNAKQLDISENGSVLRFNDVQMTLLPDKTGSSQGRRSRNGTTNKYR